MQPGGDLGLVGLSTETPFVRGPIEKLRLEPEMDHRHEYKSARNILTEEEYTEPHREADARVLESNYEDVLEGIAEARGMSVAEVEALVEAGPHFGEEAVENGLVDALGGFPTALDLAREAAGLEEDADLIIHLYPAERTLWEQLTAPVRESSERTATVRMIQRTLDRVRPALDALNQVTMKDGDRVLLAPGLERDPVR